MSHPRCHRASAIERAQYQGVYVHNQNPEPWALLLAFEWPLDQDPSHLSFAVWLANLMELLDQASCTLPAMIGTDGVACA